MSLDTVRVRPSPAAEIIDREEEEPTKSKKGVYVPQSQMQVLHSMSHLPPTAEDARHAYARMTVNLSRQRSVTNRGLPQGRIPVNQNKVRGGAKAKKASLRLLFGSYDGPSLKTTTHFIASF